jgi:hypothetical protein
MFTKKVEFFKVKWKGISTDGNTWEPASHFEGDSAKAVLAAFRKARADDKHEEDEVGDEGEDVEDDHDDDEIDKYFALPQLPYCKDGTDTDILEWWRVSARQFDLPYLAKMARQFLSMPASSAGVERLFHTAGRMHDDLKKFVGEGSIGLMLEVHQNL